MTTYHIELNQSAHINGDKKAVLDRLIKLFKENGDKAPTPEQVFEDAKKKSSPLHGEYIWDGDEAVERLGYERSRYLLVQLVVVTINTVTKDPYKGPLIINVAPAHKTAQLVSFNDPAAREQIIAKLAERIFALREQIAMYKEFSVVVAAIDKLKLSEAA